MTIPLEKLRQVTHVYTHAHCPDGMASAAAAGFSLPLPEGNPYTNIAERLGKFLRA